MSVDGKIATVTGDVELSSDEDWHRVHRLRSQVDGIMIGINTVLNDDPKLRLKYFTKKSGKLHRIVVDSNLRIPKTSKVLNYKLKTYPTIIATTENAPKSKIERISKISHNDITIIKCGTKKRVDLNIMAKKLKDIGIEKYLLEGGGTLNFSMLKNHLVDEIRIAIAPVIVGGSHAITLVEGEGFTEIAKAVHLKLIKKEMFGTNLILYYKVIT
ncbi:MAG: 2,5-diamino-6-(ribosylamino)-4(3H)-pyrimidinone 5'-phosphate reductase [Candidatus Lokiarchaeota archaeon]|nr:2,5-diamino-6-(ribosylamino)-4(3H)-pyrimidinone 5'-phosphate reductase [Candidatus Lokiarchaeota archaeon]